MKLLLFSDLHLDTPFKWADPALARSRRVALRESLQKICELALEQGVDAVVSAGDLYEHERFSPDTAEFLRTTFGDLGLPTFLAPGNHDWFGPQSLYNQVRWSDNVHVFTEDQLTAVELTEGVTLWGAAHRAPANTDGFLDRFRVDRGGVNLALFHGSEVGEFQWQESGKIAHAPFSAGQIEQVGLNHALVGHFHTPKDGEWHTYPGNPDPLTFGETGVRGAVALDVAPSGDIARTRHTVAVSHVEDVAVDLSGVTDSSAIRTRVAEAVSGKTGVVRVTLFGDLGPSVDVDVADLRNVAPALEGLIARIGKLGVAYDLDALAAENTIRGQFIQDVRAAEMDDELRRRVLITGLRALEGRTNELEVH